MGFITYDEIGPSLLPAAIYLGLHTLEGQILTPVVLGRRMALSPLILILALMVFGWLWGIIGLLLAVPLLVCVKLVLVKIEGMEGWARLLELTRPTLSLLLLSLHSASDDSTAPPPACTPTWPPTPAAG